jgi:glycosyltransferase involved in cell wall biosynthesis
MKKSKPSVLILTSSFPSSLDDETCAYVREFARRLATEFDVQVLAPADSQARDVEGEAFKLRRSKSFLPQSLNPLQASHDLHGLLSGNIFTKLFTLISVVSFFISAGRLARHADVICSHWLLPSGLIGSLIAALFHKRHLVIEHSGALHLLMRMRGGRLLSRFIVWRSHRIITVSNDLKRKLLTLYPEAEEKIEVIPMGVEASTVRAGQAPARIARSAMIRLSRSKMNVITAGDSGRRLSCPYKILFLGRLIEIKGLDVLLRAVATLPSVQLLVAGDGEQRNAFERLAEKLNVDAVFFGCVGKEGKAQLFASCDMVVIPSRVLPDGRTEGMPVVALEALAAGLPVVAASVGGLSEILIDGQNGLLFTAGNHTELAAKIKLLLDDQALRKHLSINARQTAEAFDWQIIGAKFSDIIKDALPTNGSVESYQTASDLKH